LSCPLLDSHSPRVTWLLCTHRANELLHRAIRSCLAQAMTDFELLVVVNGSEAERIYTLLISAYSYDSRVRVVCTSVPLLNFSLSFGVHLARAPLVARMDADDVSHPERLARQVAFMDVHHDVAVLGSSYFLIDPDGQIHGKVDLPETDRKIRKALRFRNPVCHPSVMLRRDVVISVGAYLGGKNAEDYDLWVRLAMNPEWKFENLPEALISYNVSPSGGARGSREAYANVAGTQFRQFLITGDIRWLFGTVVTAFKSLVFAIQP
jgi:glycosyltransferase involved in cell wall biosynthesis